MAQAVVFLHLFKPEIWLKRRNLIVTASRVARVLVAASNLRGARKVIYTFFINS